MTYVYSFEDAPADHPKELLGGKGAGLAAMTRLGIPVPPGFVITTEACHAYYEANGASPAGLEREVEAALRRIEERVGARFGDPERPLLVSVRSGARVSMPGMMDTILNLGLDDRTAEGLARQTANRRFAYDAYRRLVAMYGDVVLDVDHGLFEDALTDAKRRAGDAHMADTDLGDAALAQLVADEKRIVADATGRPFPDDPRVQLTEAIGAVFRSWNNKRAIAYRRMHGYPDDWGTAVVVQAMVFGNMGDDCGTGVAFTRNPSTGEKKLYGEYLRNAQGEDVVAGIRTPRPLTVASADPGREAEVLERTMPGAFAELRDTFERLESHFRDVQDVEFTIQRGKVWILQTRSGKRTARAAVKIAVDLVDEGAITEDEAVTRVDPWSLDQLLHPRVATPESLKERGIESIATGLPASPGAAIGKIVFDAEEAEALAKDGESVLLVRRETSPEDIGGMKAATGILTAAGGMTSHAAVVARGMGKPCVVGVSAMHVDVRQGLVAVRLESNGEALELRKGDVITIDGSRGKIYRGEVPVEPAAVSDEFERFMGWVDRVRRMRVRANADTPESARQARAFGAEGIGLCRTEHMFFQEERLEAVRCMILAESEAARAKFVAKIEPMQEADFVEIFRAMDGLPVTIRLLDWPLHEFMPTEPKDFAAIAKVLGVDVAVVDRRARALHELNPMLGHRGVRLGLTHRAIYAAQVRAILSAAARVAAEGVAVSPEIMVPLVGLAEELERIAPMLDAVVREVEAKFGSVPRFLFGTMIELPRACLVAGELARTAQFFSFGTNDLTQTTFGLSRDDAGRFLPLYASDELRVLTSDPFASLDERGVGELVRLACERGRAARPDIKLGLCGEHGGDPRSIAFCETIGLDYVSCSPFRVPIARIAAAQASLRARRANVDEITE